MVRWPGHHPKNIDRTTPVSSIDLAPTILTACGLKPTEAMQGVDLLNAEKVHSRDTVFGEIFAHDVADVENPTASLMYRWVVDGFWKLIVPHDPNVPEAEIELYNLEDDPHERTDLATDQPQRVEQLRATLDAWWRPAAGGE
jgi:uncharacterized sulfatase